MAIDDKALINAFSVLSEGNKQAAYEFMQFLAERQEKNDVERFLASLPEVNEPLSEEESRQMREATDWVSWEDLKSELSHSRE